LPWRNRIQKNGIKSRNQKGKIKLPVINAASDIVKARFCKKNLVDKLC
jgi:hypothetical protein